MQAANHCCGNFDYGEDEMQLSGLTPRPSVKVNARPTPQNLPEEISALARLQGSCVPC